MSDTVIVSAKRTPIAAFQGAFAALTAAQLGASAITGAVTAAGVDTAHIDEVIMGNVLGAGQGQAPARQAMRAAGLADSTGALTINKVCGSGLQAVVLAHHLIQQNAARVVVAGGMESMTNAPYLLPNARAGFRMGNQQVVDSMVHDGLWDPYQDYHMGVAGELCASEFNFSREAQDEYAGLSYQRAQAAQSSQAFVNELLAVEIPQRKGDPVVVTHDEEPARGNPEKFHKLRPAFAKDGTITAANASTLSDGAAALLVTSSDYANAHNLTTLGRIVAVDRVSQAPEWFTTAPGAVIPKICERAGLSVADIDLFEINEAFACVALHSMQCNSLDAEKVNVHGGAIALGHPIGASGARVLVTLLHALTLRNKCYGLATLCNGGGEAVAVIVERT